MNWFNKEKEIYQKNHPISMKLWEEATKRFPGGVSHNIRDFHMSEIGLAPPFTERVSGSKL